jgi:hypothetical protein
MGITLARTAQTVISFGRSRRTGASHAKRFFTTKLAASPIETAPALHAYWAHLFIAASTNAGAQRLAETAAKLGLKRYSKGDLAVVACGDSKAASSFFTR